MRIRTPFLIFTLFTMMLAGCTRDRPTPEATATVMELPVEPVATEADAEPQNAAEEPDVVQLTPEADDVEGTPEPEADDVPETFQYIVEPGDTLLSIALDYGTDVETVKERNNLFGDEISVGQPLLIPYVVGVIVPGMPTPTPGPYIYVVQAGETLGDIALKFGVESLAIVEASNLLDQNTLSVGQELVIPNYRPPVSDESQIGDGDTGDGADGSVTHVCAVRRIAWYHCRPLRRRCQ